MIWKKLGRSKWARNAICAVLTVAVVLSVCLPTMQRQQLQPENPLADVEMQDITMLQVGEAESLGSYVGNVSSEAEGNGSSQNGDASGEDGEMLPEDAEQQEDISQDQKEENTEGQPDNEPKDPLSDATIEPVEGPEENEDNSQQDGDQSSDGQESGGDGEEGVQDGDQGEEGGEEMELDLGLVMTWYKYGTEAKSIVCQSGNTVAKRILTAQLRDNRLRYSFELAGKDARNAQITSVTYAVGNSVPYAVDARGDVGVSVPVNPGYQNIIFRVEAVGKAQNDKGEWVQQDLNFTYVIRCENGKDLELELSWEKADGGNSTVICAANSSANREIKSAQLKNGEFNYSPRLLGQLAADSRLIAGEYRSASGEYGTLSLSGGTLTMKAAEGKDSETYYLSFTAAMVQRDDEGDTVEETVTYTITIVYKDTMDLRLDFTWFEKGVTKHNLVCELNKSVSGRVKTNELSAGALLYEMKLVGESAKDARIKAIALQCDGSSQSVSERGSVPLSIPAGGTAVTYIFTVTAEVQGKKVTFTVQISCSNDVSLQMLFTTMVDGAAQQQRITCENQKSTTAEIVFDDQLTDNTLVYDMSIIGDDAQDVTITKVQCYQSGTGRTESLGASDAVKLHLANGKTGENTFTVTARDSGGQEYKFTINIPYKHRGENLVKIATNLTDGMEVTNGTPVNLNVRAWVEDADGNTVSNILATGTNGTKITVKLDGKEIPYISASGTAQEYTLIPEDPEVGDTSEHVLYIYAEDENGNYGELTLTIIGKRTQGGQEIGTAWISIDMTVLGLGVVGPVAYTVLSEEPVSYVVAKAVWGYDAGDPFGTAKNTFGWVNGSYGGTFDVGFYLRSLTSGGPVGANALSGTRWNNFGATEEEILQYIDNYFGRGTGLATLWRCIYRNGLNLSTASSGAISEFDFTSGSGWLYSIGGGSYYPGQSMSDYYLKDGDTLTLRYTLAQGWDVGGGTDNYGNTVGYCISAMNGSISVNHQMEEVINAETGAVGYACRCCGLVEACPHENTECKDLANGTHSVYCNDCATTISEAQEHQWEYSDTENTETHTRTCKECALVEAEAHLWSEGASTATCTEPGVRTVTCGICGVTQNQDTPAKGHQTDNQYYHDQNGHYQTCEVCALEIEGSRGTHSYSYDSGWDDWFCTVCNAGHDWDYCGNSHLTLRYGSTCENLVYDCTDCGAVLTKTVAHQYVGGVCTVCMAVDPSQETPAVPETPVTPEPPTPPKDEDESTDEETGGDGSENPPEDNTQQLDSDTPAQENGEQSLPEE